MNYRDDLKCLVSENDEYQMALNELMLMMESGDLFCCENSKLEDFGRRPIEMDKIRNELKDDYHVKNLEIVYSSQSIIYYLSEYLIELWVLYVKYGNTFRLYTSQAMVHFQYLPVSWCRQADVPSILFDFSLI